MLRLIAAMDAKRGIADEDGIPWQGKIPLDTTRFHDLTLTGIIVMGYGTYEEYDKPLHGRDNFVVSHRDGVELRPGFVLVSNAEEFIAEHEGDVVWLIGGAALFAQTLSRADQLFLTRVGGDYHCTKFFPTFSDAFESQSEADPHVESGVTFHFEIWQRRQAAT